SCARNPTRSAFPPPTRAGRDRPASSDRSRCNPPFPNLSYVEPHPAGLQPCAGYVPFRPRLQGRMIVTVSPFGSSTGGAPRPPERALFVTYAMFVCVSIATVFG